MRETPHIFVLNRIRTLGKTTKWVALDVNLCEKSFRTKSQHPDTFTIGELKRTFSALSMTKEEQRDYLKTIGFNI